ncbi:AMP-binding protein [Enteractinococcus coprophilus]|uniref:Acetyl-CoA synthetase n=1 Tax=Enteractinococcus coprophilus TaxID=1027633 RepID=A0A543AF53_9MICC|nr:AMP-binding protein [Enteractinococcus coprophilus]TQL71190.1 acetyl-CoA synthetase [Enteractinococcus coprophilus]
MNVTEQYRAARDRLMALDPTEVAEKFVWPSFDHFNFGLDWFDALAKHPVRGSQPALIVTGDTGTTRLTFAELSARSTRVAGWFQSLGVTRGDKFMMMLDNEVELWEAMLAAIKIGAVILPTTVMLNSAALASRMQRAGVNWVLTNQQNIEKFADLPSHGIDMSNIGLVVTGDQPVANTHAFTDAYTTTAQFVIDGPTPADAEMLVYFTSGTTSEPKMVLHTQQSYSVGHFSTLYWLGVNGNDVHLNISSPGWGKHAWSSFFGPWIGEATVLSVNYARFDAATMLEVIEEFDVTSLCAPPTVWRMLIHADMGRIKNPPRNAVSAGEPLNLSTLEKVRDAWGVTIRDGYGQTETTLQIATTPGLDVPAGALGKPLPGFAVELVDEVTEELIIGPGSGQVALRLNPGPVGLTPGYYRDEDRNLKVFGKDLYLTGDLMSRDADGVYTYVGRADDLFKASDYKLSPFELENGLMGYPSISEVAVVPSPDPIRTAVPKAYVVLAPGYTPTPDTAQAIFAHARTVLPPYGRIRRLEFATELPKTVSGKIRRVVLREDEIHTHGDQGQHTSGVMAARTTTEGYGHEYTDAQFRR